MIEPQKMNDERMFIAARDIAKRIETEMDYPGQIKIHLIRESRAIEYAK
jgi:ribonuclease Y